MRTNIDLNDELLDEFKKLSKSKTKREAVNKALEEAINLRRRGVLLDSIGKVQWEGDLDGWRKSKWID